MNTPGWYPPPRGGGRRGPPLGVPPPPPPSWSSFTVDNLNAAPSGAHSAFRRERVRPSRRSVGYATSSRGSLTGRPTRRSAGQRRHSRQPGRMLSLSSECSLAYFALLPPPLTPSRALDRALRGLRSNVELFPNAQVEVIHVPGLKVTAPSTAGGDLFPDAAEPSPDLERGRACRLVSHSQINRQRGGSPRARGHVERSTCNRRRPTELSFHR